MKRVTSNKSADESWGNAFVVDTPLTNSYVVAQVLLMHTLERTQKVTHLRPHAFTSVGMYFSDAIVVVIPCPLSSRVAHDVVLAPHSAVPTPFVSAQSGRCSSEVVHVTEQSRRIGSMSHSQPHLPTLPAYRADDRRTVALISAMTSEFVGSSPRWIPPVEVLLTFFPPHSGTSHQSQYAGHRVVCWVGGLVHFVVVVCVSGVQYFWQLLTRLLWWRCSPPSTRPSSAIPPGKGLGDDAQTLCLSISYTHSDTFDTCTPASVSGASCETAELAQLAHNNPDLDNAALVRESAPLSIWCSLVRLANRLSEIPYLHFIQYLHSFQS